MNNKKHRLGFLIILILLFGILTSHNLIKKHNNFEDLPDLLVFETSIYNTLKGHFLYNFRGGDVCHLGIHFSPILLIHVPFYALYKNVFTLFLVQGLIVGAGALGIYLLSVRLLKNNNAALILSAAFLLNPLILGGVLWSVHEEPLVVPFLTFALYAWIKRRWTIFWLLMCGVLLCKETITLTTAFMGAALVIRYRRVPVMRRNGAILFIASICWFLITTKILMPMFSPLSPSDLQMSARYDARIGHTITEIFLNMFHHPMFFFDTILQVPKIKYVFNLFLPFAFICFFSPKLLLPSVPVIMMNILAFKYKWHATLLHQYTIVLAPVLFFATIDGVRRIRVFNYLRRKRSGEKTDLRKMKRFIVFSCILIFSGSIAGCFSSGIHRWIFYNRDSRISYLPLSSTPESLSATREALSLIPPDAAVSASHLLANHLAKRRIIYYNRDPEIRFLPFEYYVIVKTGRNGDEPEEFSEESIQFFKDECKVIFRKGRILVLKRKAPPMSLEEYRKKRKNGL